ncbi:MAG: NAD(P)-binding domain-containing protein, partial [Sporomusa sp.]
MKLGFIGFGEVGFEMASGLRGEGLKEILAYDVMRGHPQFGGLLAERVAKAGVMLVDAPEKILQCVDVAIIAVPGDKALETAQGLKSKLTAGMLYVDVSASSPDVKKSIFATIQDTGVAFVDGAMLGSLPLFQHKVPTLVSGTGSDRFLELMQPYHMKLEKVSDVPGEATAIKLIRSIFMKGLPALFVEVLEAASRMKVDHLVLKS